MKPENLLSSLSILFLLSILSLQNVSGQKNKCINLGDYYDPDSPTAGFQEAVDYLTPGGGEIYVPPGIYKIRRSIVLNSGIYIRGNDNHSIIERLDSCIQLPLVKDCRKGGTEISPKDISGFFIGGEITVYSDSAWGWNSSCGAITEIEGNTLVIDTPLEKDYLLEENAMIMNFFPVFTAIETENIRIENLVIDGKMKPGSNYYNEFVTSAIHFKDVLDVHIEKVTVRNYPADGFSIQGGRNAFVSNCLAEYNHGNGFHPGTTINESTWINNIGRYNGWDGLYFCFNVRYTTVSGNHFYKNGKNGIGGLGWGGVLGDQMNVVDGNYCFENQKSGIECTTGKNNIIVNNICENNSQEEAGKWPGIYLKNTSSTIIRGNRCCNTGMNESGKTQGNGILFTGECLFNVVTDNILSGHLNKDISGEYLDKNLIKNNMIYNNN